LLHPKSKPEMNKHMKNIIVITGASSGFGALTARALAKAGHTVYASIRETKGRNAPQVEEAKKFPKDNNVDLRTIELDVASQASADAAISKDYRRQRRRTSLVNRKAPPSLFFGCDFNLTIVRRHERSCL
jgi:NADP-dependent 3-hydroxy acid dehydrogenase YdfG